MNRPQSGYRPKRILFVTLSVAPWIVLIGSITYAITAINGSVELVALIPIGVAVFYKDLGFAGKLAGLMIPISYLGAFVAATIATVSTRIRIKNVFLFIVCFIVATNYIGCSSMRDEFSRARVGG